MNFKNIATRAIGEFSEGIPVSKERPEMTLGEILYSILREKNSGIKDIGSIKSISDEDMYTLIYKAKETEQSE